MTIEMLTTMLDTIAADSSYYVCGNHISLTIEDFEGFDEDWSEVYRDYADEDAVDAVIEWLEEHADFVDGDFYYYYHFGDIEVQVGYSSYDI